MRSHLALPILTFALVLPSRVLADDNWPAFRGPSGDGHAAAVGLPLQWDEKTNVRWKTAIHGKAWSSPVLWGRQVWMTTATEDGKQLFAVCVDRDTGKVLHDVKVFDIAEPAFCHAFNSYASSTPVLEEGRVYVHFGSAGTACLDTATAKVLWQRQDLPCDHFRGAGSLILYGDLLILTLDGFDLQYLAALNKNTGKTVWKKDRNIVYDTTDGDWRKAYSTPKVIQVGGKDQLISPSAMSTMAYNPLTGEEIWRVNHGGMNAAIRPLFAEGKLFLTTGYKGFQLFALRPEGSGDITKTHVVWSVTKAVPSRPSPLYLDGLLYMISDNGIATCVEAATGKEVNQVRLNGAFSASPLYADKRLYFCSQEGSTYVLEASRELKLLATNKLDDGCMASPAAVGKGLFIRTKTSLYRLEAR